MPRAASCASPTNSLTRGTVRPSATSLKGSPEPSWGGTVAASRLAPSSDRIDGRPVARRLTLRNRRGRFESSLWIGVHDENGHRTVVQDIVAHAGVQQRATRAAPTGPQATE